MNSLEMCEVKKKGGARRFAVACLPPLALRLCCRSTQLATHLNSKFQQFTDVQ